MSRAEGSSKRFYDSENWLSWYNYTESMPNCFEKTLRTVVLAVWLRVCSLNNHNIQSEPEYAEAFEKLDTWLNGFWKDFSRYRSEWETEDTQHLSILFDTIQSLIDRVEDGTNVEVLSGLLNEFKTLLSKLVKFDFLRFRILHALNQEKAFELKDKVVILLLGRTGAGKSTFTTYLSGMKLVEEERNGFKAWYLDQEHESELKREDALASVKIASQRGESETRFISPIKMKVSKYFPKNGRKAYKPPKYLRKFRDFYVVDAAGFGDTEGPAVDAASIYGTVYAAQQAEHVIPLIFISSADGNHLQHARQFLRSLSSIFQNLSHLAENRSFGYVFTRFQNDAVNIRRIFSDMMKNMSDEEKSDVGFKTLVANLEAMTAEEDADCGDSDDYGGDDNSDDVDSDDENADEEVTNEEEEAAPIEKVFNPDEEYHESINVFNPSKSSDPKNAKKDMRRILKIPEEGELLVPSDDFTLSLPLDVRRDVEDGIQYQVSLIESAIARKDLRAATFYLKNICDFVELFQDRTLKRSLERAKKIVGEALTKHCSARTQVVEEKVKNEDYCLVTTKDLKPMLEEYMMVKDEGFNKLKSLIGEEYCSVSSQSVLNAVDTCLELLKTCLSNMDLGQDPHRFINILKSMLAFSQTFPGKNDENNQAVASFNHLIHRLEQCAGRVDDFVKNGNMNDAAQCLSEIKILGMKLEGIYQEYQKFPGNVLNIEPAAIYQNCLESGVIGHIDRLTKSTLEIFETQKDQPKRMSEDNVIQVKDSLEQLQSIASTTNLLVHLPDSYVQQKISSILELSMQVFQALQDTFNAKMQVPSAENFSKLEDIYRMIKQLVSIDDSISNYTETSMRSFVDSVIASVNQMQQLILKISQFLCADQVAKPVQDQSESPLEISEEQAQKFPKIVEALSASSWIDELQEGLLSDNLSNLDRELKFAANQLGIRFQQLSFSSIEDLAPTAKIVKSFEILQFAEQKLPSITGPRQEVESKFKERQERFIEACLEVAPFLTPKADRLSSGPDLFLDVPRVVEHAAMAAKAHELGLKEPRDGLTYQQISDQMIQFGVETCGLCADLITTHISHIVEYFEGDSNDDSDLPKWVMEAHRGFSLMSSFKSESKFQHYANTKTRDIETQLTRIHLDVQSKLQQCVRNQQSAVLDRQVQLASLLSRFDSNIENETCKFAHLAHQYATKLSDAKNGHELAFNTALNGETFDFVAISNLWRQMNLDQTESPFRKRVVRKVFQLIDDALLAVRKLPKKLDAMEKVMACDTKYLRPLSAFKRHVLCLLDTEEQDRFTKYTDKIVSLIDQKLTVCLGQARLKFDLKLFNDAETILEDFRHAIMQFDEWISDKTQKKLEDFEEDQRQKLDDIIGNFQTLPLKSYMFNPPKSLQEELFKGRSTNGQYANALAQLNQYILEKFNQHLGLQSDIDVEESTIKDAEIALEYVEGDIKSTAKRYIDSAKERLRARNDQFDDSVKLALDGDGVFDAEQVSKLLQSTKTLEQRRTIQTKIQNSLSTSIDSLNADLEPVRARFILESHKFKLPNTLPWVNRLTRLVTRLFDETLVRCAERASNFMNDIPQTPNRDQESFNKPWYSLHQIVEVALLEGMSELGVNGRNMQLQVQKLAQDLRDCWMSYEKTILSKAEDYTLEVDEAEDILKMLQLNRDIFDALKLDSIKSYNLIVKEIAKCCSKVKIQCETIDTVAENVNSEKRGREEFGLIQRMISFLREMTRVDDHFELNIQNTDLTFCESTVFEFAKAIHDELRTLLDDGNDIQTDDLHRVNKQYKILEYYCYCELPQHSKVSPKTLKKDLSKMIFKSFSDILDGDVEALDPKIVAIKLIEVQELSSKLSFMKQPIRDRVEKFLDDMKRKLGMNSLEDLAIQLQSSDRPEGMEIISSYTSMQAILREIIGRKLKTHGIDYVMSRIKGDDIDVSKLGEKYQVYQKKYEEHLQGALACSKQEQALQTLADAAINLTSQIRPQEDEKGKLVLKWSTSIKKDFPELLAVLSVMWTIYHAEDYFMTKGGNERRYLLQPHPAQVITLFRLLGMDNPQAIELEKQLVQVGTGEGKSLILGILASVFGLLKYDVSCACYSQYLSTRDYAAFSFMFDCLKINNQVHYGTFKDLCERSINKFGSVRDIVRSILLNEPLDQTSSTTSNRLSVLLIDEVDVFFKPDFYGQVYIPKCSVPHPTLIPLIEKIWKTSQEQKLEFQTVADWPEYAAVVSTFSEWPTIVEESVKSMVLDSRPDPNHHYEIKDGKIGYKEHDGTVFNLVYGYKTMFAWLKERDNNKVTQEACEAQMNMKLDCGTFSFAEIPKSFDCLLGVTGTLEQLSDPEKGVIVEYDIKKQTFMPSVFGDNKRQFAQNGDVHVESDEDYYVTLAHEIESIIKSDPGKDNACSALVFFKNRRELDECRRHPLFQNIISENIPVLDESVNEDEKEDYVKNATRCGALLFATRPFGRGTDFKIYDKKLESNGGCHVIQTFLSEEAAEETQIMGRSARQGDKGSYCLIIKESDLEQFLISPEEVQQAKDDKQLYQLLKDKRDIKFKQFYETATSQVGEVRREHVQAVELRQALLDGKKTAIERLLGMYNKAAGEKINSRTLVLMDATASMHNLMAKSKATARKTFDRTADILSENNVPPDCFSVQFGVYRNYNADHETLFQSSPWVQNPKDLVQFLDHQGAMYGWGNEAVEIGLHHAVLEANTEDGLSQVIIIGDAAANTEDEVTAKRDGKHGEAYWQKDPRFQTPTNWKAEIDQLNAKNVPVNCFYVADRAKENFSEMASSGNGTCAKLDVNSDEGEKLLTDQVTMLVLQSLDSGDGSLVEAYKRKYMAGYQ